MNKKRLQIEQLDRKLKGFGEAVQVHKTRYWLAQNGKGFLRHVSTASR